ncbi:hypothetical protein LIER_13175 [Lithospermum erythrorhizon]|uniref:Uncharacterized protein n=1 Tax=Lithospermum erythrorhizon TaxID=34254 RepID=A0AAV3PUI7_LITER
MKKTQAERDAADPATFVARREKEGMRLAYFKDNPLRYRRIGAVVLSDFILSDFVLNFQDQAPTLPALAEEYRQRFPTRWLNNIVPLPPLRGVLLIHFHFSLLHCV